MRLRGVIQRRVKREERREDVRREEGKRGEGRWEKGGEGEGRGVGVGRGRKNSGKIQNRQGDGEMGSSQGGQAELGGLLRMFVCAFSLSLSV